MNRHTLIVFAALVAVLGCLVWVGEAEAGQFGPGRPFGEAELAALANAEAYWGRQPVLCSSRTVEVVAPGALGVDEYGHDVIARATQPVGEALACGMWVEEDALGPDLCSTIRHEYGHWLGFGHEDAELAQMPLCVLEVAVWEAEMRLYRRAEWGGWREFRALCQSRRNQRGRRPCFRELRDEAQRIRSELTSYPDLPPSD